QRPDCVCIHMNAFGMRSFRSCQFLLSILFCAGSSFGAGEQKPAALELKPATLDLIYKSLDLKFTVEELSGGAQDLKGKNEATTGGAIALKSKVVDLVAKGVDVKETATEIKINLLGDIFFDFDKTEIRPVAEPTLAQVAKLIQSRASSRVL